MSGKLHKVVSVEMLSDLSLIIEYSDGTKEHSEGIADAETINISNSSKNK